MKLSDASHDGTDRRLLRIAPEDNVLVLLAPIRPGEVLALEGQTIAAPGALPLGHKIAARDITAGQKIVKYGVPIGSATEAIAAGAHVHTHNLRSDYLPGPLEH